MSLLTPKEACIEFQLSLSSIYTGVQKNRLPALRIGRVFRVIPDGFFKQDIPSIFPQKLKTKDVCGILKISLPTVYRLIESGAFPAIYCGKALRIPRDSFFMWIRCCSTRPARQIAVIEVSDYINNIILNQHGGFYHG